MSPEEIEKKLTELWTAPPEPDRQMTLYTQKGGWIMFQQMLREKIGTPMTEAEIKKLYDETPDGWYKIST